LEQVDHWQSFLALVNMIMFCTGIPGHYPVNETTSSLTLTFWYTLQVRPSSRSSLELLHVVPLSATRGARLYKIIDGYDMTALFFTSSDTRVSKQTM